MPTEQKKVFSPLTPKLAWQLAAPHTWVAAYVGVLLSGVYTIAAYSGHVNLVLLGLLLLICVFMQSSVNVFNDYFDYTKGTDSLENSSEDAFDAVLVYNNLNPKSVLALAIGYLVCAGIIGVYIVYSCGWIPLLIGLIGAMVVVIYSGGKTPISYLPIGEFISGIVMGSLIPLACTYVLSGVLDFFVLVLSIPLAVGIGMILATNNTCDIEKDIDAKRKTLAVVLGRTEATNVYRLVIMLWIILTIILVGILYTKGLPIMAFMLIGIFPVARALFKNPLIQQSREVAMSQIVMLNVIISAFYCLAILVNTTVIWF
ncbi:putative uncharacterized protein [Eggerthella sp. CAG:368]|nr:putative uncharacterized protein [Eggerthella sp. CAG:368]